MTQAIKAVFITQYGFWWKLSLAEWIQLCQGALGGDGYSLPDEKELKRRPWSLVGSTDYGDGSRKSFYALKDDVKVVEPLDWEPDDFQAELNSLTTP